MFIVEGPLRGLMLTVAHMSLGVLIYPIFQGQGNVAGILKTSRSHRVPPDISIINLTNSPDPPSSPTTNPVGHCTQDPGKGPGPNSGDSPSIHLCA